MGAARQRGVAPRVFVNPLVMEPRIAASVPRPDDALGRVRVAPSLRKKPRRYLLRICHSWLI